jgi:transposase
MSRRQTIPPQQRFTIRQFNETYSSEAICLDSIMQSRWPGRNVFCVNCKVDRKHYRLKGRTAYCCPACGNHVFPLAGTIFHKSTTPLTTWFFVIKMMTSTRVGISAKQIQRETGVTYKTAWRMMKQIRLLMSEEIKLGGQVEMDETYIGGHRKGTGTGRPAPGDKKLTPVVGVVERQGKVIALVTPDVRSGTLLKIVRDNVLPSTLIYTDEFNAYDGIAFMPHGYSHQRIRHADKVYAVGDVHTNTIEGFWSLVKRGIKGVYYQVGRKYLQSYLNEYTFRYNRRHVMRPMFLQLLERVPMQVCPCSYETQRTALRLS